MLSPQNRIKAPEGSEAQPESWTHAWGSGWKWLPEMVSQPLSTAYWREWKSQQCPPVEKGSSLRSEALAWLA